ncbi:MAG: Gldg family protein [Ruminococcus sp.]|nr:Gldg family protein [Ruminococcus sp.]
MSKKDLIENNTPETPEGSVKKDKKPNKFIAFLKSRKAKRGTIATAIVAVFICLIILLNFVTGLLTDRFPSLQFDMTSSQSYQLQKDTSEYISKLKNDITVYVLTRESTFKSGLGASSGAQYFVQADKLLKKMDAANDKLTVKFIDLSSNPTFTGKYTNIDWNAENANNLIIVDAGDNYTALSLDDCFDYDSESYNYSGTYAYTGTKIEQAVITGILDVTTADKIGIDIITGSGEDEEHYGALQTLLKQNAYSAKEINLTTQKLRKASKIAILYAPTVDLSKDAVTKVSDWLNNGGEKGKTLIYIPMDVKTSTPNLDELLAEYGMKVSDGLAFCTSNNYVVQNPYMFLTDYKNDTYTADLKDANIPTIVYNTRNIQIKDSNKASALLSVESSVGVIPFSVDTSELKSESDLEKYKKKSVNAAAIGSDSSDSKKSNIAVFASPYMFTGTFLNTTSYNNSNYIVNFCNTVTNRGDMGITIKSAGTDEAELGVTSASTVIAIGTVFIGVIPIIILIIGLVVFIRRRIK